MNNNETRSLREIKKSETQDAIIHAARDLFNKKGYYAATVNEIAAKAHISPASLFNYYPSKLEILKKVEQMKLDDYNKIIMSNGFAEKSHKEQLLELLNNFLIDASKYPRVTMEITEMHSLGTLDNNTNFKLGETIQEIIKNSIRNGELKETTDIEFIKNLYDGLSFCPILNGSSVEECLSTFKKILAMCSA